MKHPYVIPLIASASLLLGGCVLPASKSGSVYDNPSSGTMQQVSFGRVVDVRRVVIDKSSGSTQGFGAGVGGALGGIAGSSVGKQGSRGSYAGGVIGAGVGAAVGDMAMHSLSKVDGLEIAIKLESGQVVAIAQEADIEFAVGQCVKVAHGNQARVSHYQYCGGVK